MKNSFIYKVYVNNEKAGEQVINFDNFDNAKQNFELISSFHTLQGVISSLVEMRAYDYLPIKILYTKEDKNKKNSLELHYEDGKLINKQSGKKLWFNSRAFDSSQIVYMLPFLIDSFKPILSNKYVLNNFINDLNFITKLYIKEMPNNLTKNRYEAYIPIRYLAEYNCNDSFLDYYYDKDKNLKIKRS